jgi:SAM-dependent methyltransferase
MMRSEHSYGVSAAPSSWLVPGRLEQPELLDLGFGSPADVEINLAEMWRSNRYLGGLRALTVHLYPRLAACSGTISVLDLGTGNAQLPRAIARDHDLRIIGVDWARRNLATAQTQLESVPVQLVQADASHLPFPAGSVDFVISSLFLHHFPPEGVIGVLRSAFACARHGLVMTDLVRGWLPLAAFRLAQPIIARNFLTRHDGALSIRRAYTPAELRQLAAQAELPNPKIFTHWPWRMTLVVDR